MALEVAHWWLSVGSSKSITSVKTCRGLLQDGLTMRKPLWIINSTARAGRSPSGHLSFVLWVHSHIHVLFFLEGADLHSRMAPDTNDNQRWHCLSSLRPYNWNPHRMLYCTEICDKNLSFLDMQQSLCDNKCAGMSQLKKINSLNSNLLVIVEENCHLRGMYHSQLMNV